MAIIVGDCPRCGAQHTTFDVSEVNPIGQKYGWQSWFECFSVCRNCRRASVLVLAGDVNGHPELRDQNPLKLNVSLNNAFKIERYLSLRDKVTLLPPDHVPDDIASAFNEAATCMAVQCWNAAGAMFRLCVDLTTKPMLPTEEVEGLNSKTRRDLGLRLPWLFDHGQLPNDMRNLSACIHQDGNDAAHTGKLTKVDAEDLLDFTQVMLERIFTEPKRLEMAAKRRVERRKQA